MREVDKIYQKDTGTSVNQYKILIDFVKIQLLDDGLPETEPVGEDKQSESGSGVDIECHLCDKTLRISSAEQTEVIHLA